MEMYLCICDGGTVSKALEVRLWGGQDLCELPEQDMDGRSGGPLAVPQARQPDGAGAIGLDVRMQDWGTELKAWGIERIVNREGDDERVVAVRPKRAGRTPHRALPFQRPARIGGSCKQPRWQDALLLLPSQHSCARHWGLFKATLTRHERNFSSTTTLTSSRRCVLRTHLPLERRTGRELRASALQLAGIPTGQLYSRH